MLLVFRSLSCLVLSWLHHALAARSPSCTLQYRYVYTSLYVYFYRSTMESMEDTRLDDLMVLRCEKDLTDTIKLEDVLDEWSMKPRR